MNAENSLTTGPDPEPLAPALQGRGKLGFACLLPALVVAGLLAWHWYESGQQMAELRQGVARQLADAAVLARKDAEADQQLLARTTALDERLQTVEQRLAEFRDQEAALQDIFQNVARGREEAELLEIEQAVTLAVQQIQLAGNVPVALLALRTADAQLARLDKARHLPLRRALAADISRLNELPLVDVPGISLRLEQIIAGIDRFPFAVHARPLGMPEKADDEGEKSQPTAAMPWWRLVLSDLWQETQSMIRIQRFDRAEPALLAPGQGFFLRENLRLRLLSARLALFSREQLSFRNDLEQARAWLKQYFSSEDRAVQAAIEQLSALSAAEIVIELPDLRASQQALVSLREEKGAR